MTLILIKGLIVFFPLEISGFFIAGIFVGIGIEKCWLVIKNKLNAKRKLK